MKRPAMPLTPEARRAARGYRDSAPRRRGRTERERAEDFERAEAADEQEKDRNR